MDLTSNINPTSSNTNVNDITNIETRFNYIINKINLLKDDSKYEDMLTYNYSYAKLDLYKYYKQATIGDCNIPAPSIDNKDEYRKWSSWNEAKNVSKKDAMTSYINIYEAHLGKINEIRINDLERKLEMLLNNTAT